MPGIEFLPDEPGDAESEELLESGARRALPRWLIPLGVVVIGAAAVAISLSRGGGSSAPHLPVAAPSVPSRPSGPVPVDDHLGPPVDAEAGPVLSVAIAGETSWVLHPRELHSLTRLGNAVIAQIPGSSLIARTNGYPVLVPDVPAGVLWVVVEGDPRGRVLEYDIVGLRVMRQIAIGNVSAAAALDGHLYVTRGDRLIDIASSGPPVRIGAVSSPIGSIVTDSARDRLLMTDLGRRTRIWPIYPNAGEASPIGRPATVLVGNGTLAVAAGAIWLGGLDVGHGLLMRLDPHTLQPSHHSVLDPLLEPRAVLVASGVVVIWVRDSTGRELRCVDAAAGDQLQSWLITGPVASGGGAALVATGAGAIPLELSSCSG